MDYKSEASVDEKKETDDNATKSEYVPPPRAGAPGPR